MSLIRIILARLRSLGRRAHQERDLDDELRGYVETLTTRYEREGLAPEAARRAALVEAGGVEQVKEEVRGVRVGAGIATVLRDVRYGGRVLRRAPAYAAVVILTIALGIGINVTMFSVMRAVLWRALPYPDASRVVAIEVDTRGLPSAYSAPGATLDLRNARLISHVAMATGVNASLTVGDVMERVNAASVTDELMPMVGAVPLELGRTLVTSQDVTGDSVSGVVISHDLWQRRFQGDPHVLGRHFDVNNIDVQVVGVTRPGFRVYLPTASHVEEQIDVWFATGFEPARIARGGLWFGTLNSGVTVPQAQAEIDALAAGVSITAPGTSASDRMRLRVTPLADVITADARPALLALGAAVSLVLLIACVNVANLLLARAKTRERELAVRRALGATRLRLVRQLLAENLVFTGLGGAGGVLIAWGGIALIEWLRPAHLPRQADISIDGVVLAWAAGLAMLSSVVFGVVPAILFTKEAIGQPLSSGRSSVMQRSRRLQRGLVVAEVALSIVPLVAAGLMLRTFINLTQAPIGFNPSNVVTGTILMSFRAFPGTEARWALDRRAVELVSQLPGVEAASAGGPLPFTPFHVTRRYWNGDEPRSARSIGNQQTILPGYFHVLGIPLRAGRDITDDDITLQRSVVVIDERLANDLWHGDALGKKLCLERGKNFDTLEVIGITAPIRSSRVRDEATPMMFVPFHVYDIEVTLVVKTREPIEKIGPVIKHTVESLGTKRPMFGIETMDSIVAGSFDDTRFTMLVLGGFAGAALLLAGIGLYGTLAYLISQRTQEFGVRMALGATSGNVVRLVLREGGTLTAAGAGMGLGSALIAMRALRQLLYGVTPLDRITIGGVIALVAVVALVAVGRPAWSAAHVDPNVALRGD
jgi:putative ABC transport system permease protein